jgi:hypothetical protein
MLIKKTGLIFLAVIFTFSSWGPAVAADTAELAKQVANPIASLISVPFQNNFESGLGPAEDIARYTLRVQPVIPTKLNQDWNLITRPIFSYLSLSGGASQSGLDDTQLQFFFTPNQVQPGELMWGAGPILLLPTAADAALGTEKWGIGPSVCLLQQDGGWTKGLLMTHLWSVAGNASRGDISFSYLQPFISHSTKTGTSFTFSSESDYDWLSGESNIPLIAGVGQILPIAGHYFSFSASAIYHLQSPIKISPWAGRVAVTLLLPKK